MMLNQCLVERSPFLVYAEFIFKGNELGILLMTINLTKSTKALIKSTVNFPREQLSNVKKEKIDLKF
jgi:hypothetical protein